MTPAAHNLGGDTREKLPICERLRVDAKWHRWCSRADQADNADRAADTIEALVEAVEKCRDFLIHEAGFEDEDEPLKSLLAALSRARNGGTHET
jgi:hypothetical protein